MKSQGRRRGGRVKGRPPHGGRGLKLAGLTQLRGAEGSSSTRRTWIEIQRLGAVSPGQGSSSARRTWIEMVYEILPVILELVVLHTEDVD